MSYVLIVDLELQELMRYRRYYEEPYSTDRQVWLYKTVQKIKAKGGEVDARWCH
jgi:hypothetical protein